MVPCCSNTILRILHIAPIRGRGLAVVRLSKVLKASVVTCHRAVQAVHAARGARAQHKLSSSGGLNSPVVLNNQHRLIALVRHQHTRLSCRSELKLFKLCLRIFS